MLKKIFKNRMIQEPTKVMRKLRGTWIDSNANKKRSPDTPYGLFAVCINPHCRAIDAVQLERDFRAILSHYYHWRYGSKWLKINADIQVPFHGIIEKQAGETVHIHLVVQMLSMEELAIFVGYIYEMFKLTYCKTSYKAKVIYDLSKYEEYIKPVVAKKDRYVSKRRIEKPVYIDNKMFMPSLKQIASSDIEHLDKRFAKK